MTKIQTHPSTIVYGFAASGIIETVREGIVNVKSELGVEEHVIRVGDDPLELNPNVAIEMVGVRDRIAHAEPYCEVCGERAFIHEEIDIHPKQSCRFMRRID